MSKTRESLDRLNELPDSLVLNILSLLPMRDVVMTTLLSKRFKDLWTTVPCLNFKSDVNDYNESDDEYDEYGKYKYPNIRFPKFVNRALILWRGTKILKFEIVLFHYELPPFSDLNVWLRFAMENEVEKLNVNLLADWEPDQFPQFTEYCPPQRLYSCLSIRKLYLAGCKLKIDGSVQWDKLKYLKIDGESLSEHVMNQILSGTPQLEVLSFRLVEIFEDLTIHSGDPYGKYVMMNVSSLTNATADIFYLPKNRDIVQFLGCKLLEDIMGQVNQTNRHVEKVTLSDRCIKMLGEMKKQEKRVFEPLSNAKFLKVYNCKVDGLMELLEIFPKLTKLVLENRWEHSVTYQFLWGINDPSITKFDTGNRMESQTGFPESCLLHLTTVEIECYHNVDSKFPIVEFFLKNASKLEKLVLRATGSWSDEPDLWLGIPRSSPTAKVIFCRDDS